MPTPQHAARGRSGRLLGAAAAALLATLGVVAVGPSAMAADPIQYVGQGGTVELAPATVCVPQNPPAAVQIAVVPPDAGVASFGPNGCGLSFTASATFLGAAVVGVQAGSASPALIQVTVVPANEVVVQGDTVELLPVGPCPGQQIPPATQVGLVPAEAGVVFIRPNRCGIGFTASRAYVGPVTIGVQAPGGAGAQISRTVIKVPANFVKPAATASGSFTPVVPPPPPGPCIVISSNAIVSFGDVTIGGDFKNAPTPPSVAGCASSTVRQDVLVQTSSATNGPATLAPACGGATPATCIPADGFYAVGIPADALIVGQTPSLWLNARAGDFADQAAGLAVRMPPTLAPTFVGSVFTFDVTFTAVID